MYLHLVVLRSDYDSDSVADENVYVIACMEGEKLLIFWSAVLIVVNSET